MNCKACGNVIEEGAHFCANCGVGISDADNDVNVAAKVDDTKSADTVDEAFCDVTEQTEDMPAMTVRSEEEKPDDMMEKADSMVEEFGAEKEAEEKKDSMPAVVQIKKNHAAVTVFNTILAVFFTGTLFMAAGIFMLSHNNFDEFYKNEVFGDIYANIDFWVLTCSWYAIAMYVIVVLLAVIMFLMLKRRKYAILNYVGIPAIVDGVIFLLIGCFGSFISNLLQSAGIIKELFKVIGTVDDIRKQIILSALIIMGAGIVMVLMYLLISVIHKAVHRRRCRKEEGRHLA